ncbi:hypothetical protein ACFQ3S_19185 [Mucilaginibacter terrae]|uniref:hypothetical protein n=1 Tax=Mucilaginibacter terrae TaxID=1955052 RepID=UPI00363870CF
MDYPVIVVPFLNVDGMAFYPFVLVKNQTLKQDALLIRHETIHLKQAAELFVIPFYLLYLFNYIINRFKYPDHYRAYYEIIFEREAYQNEGRIDYLKTRKLWAWRHYFSNKAY